MSRNPWVLWMLAAIALMAGLQRYSVAPAQLLALILLLRAARLAPNARTAWLGSFVAYAVAQLVVLDDAFYQAPTTVRVAIDVGTSLLLALPIALHRALLARLPDSLSWLPFGCSVILLEWVFAQGPYGSWGALAYSFTDALPLLQWAAFGGIGLVALLACAFAALIELAWARAPGQWRPPALAAACVAVIVVAIGAWRIQAGAAMPTQRVAAVALADADYARLVAGRSMRELAQAPPATRVAAGEEFARGHAQLLALTNAALAAGAKLVVWPETVPALEEQFGGLATQAQALAATHDAEILITPWRVQSTTRSPFGRNTAVGIDATGVRFEFDKAHPVPGVEINIRGHRLGAQAWSTAVGAATVSICMDYDFPAHIRAAADGRPGWLLAPSDDWPQIRRLHADMHRVRAIENGSSLVRATHNGYSLLADPYGRVIARAASEQVVMLVGDLPGGGVVTLHQRLGAWVELLALAAFALLLLPLAITRRGKFQGAPPADSGLHRNGMA